MTPEDRAVLDAITQIYSRDAHRISPTALVAHDPIAGRACVRIDAVMAAGLEAQGYDLAVYAQNYAANLRRSGLWPADLRIVPRSRTRRWSRRGWRVVIGRG